MSDIFLSYDGKDLDRAKVLASALSAEGWTVFFDRTIPPGQTWRQFIGKEIDQCRCMIVAWSKNSISSHWVCEEADIGLKRTILVPVLFDQVSPPLGFASLQAASLVDWQGETDSSWYLALTKAVVDRIGPGESPSSKVEKQHEVHATAAKAAAPTKQVKSDLKTSAASDDTFIEPEMVVIPAGSFQMGSNNSYEAPIHQVTIAKPFSMAKYPVTFEQYTLYTKANNLELPKDEGWGQGKRPVINVSWDDAQAYAKWLSDKTGKSYRLPSEAEWEYAARANTTSDYYWGDEENAGDYAWFDKNSKDKTHPVGQKKPNAFGLNDMSGNVLEWVQDCWHENYNNAPGDDSPWLEQNGGNCSLRVLRGGSWNDRPRNLRSANRGRDYPGDRDDDIGFRLAQD